MLRQGSAGGDVANLQQQLANLGYNVGPIDGKFGPQTAAAVRAFQQDKGLSVDGIVGPQTTGALGGASSAPPPAQTAPPPGGTSTTPGAPAPTATQQDAFATMQATLAQYGLSGMQDWLWSEITANHPESQIMLDLHNQPAYKAAFPEEDAMRAAGLPVPTPADILRVRNQYRQGLAEMGFDTKQLTANDYVPLVTQNIDPTEFLDRLKTFQKVSTQFTPAMRQAFLNHAGISLSDTDVYRMFHGMAPDLVMQYANATGTAPADPAHFVTALTSGGLGVTGGAAPTRVSETQLEQAVTSAEDEQKALFHHLSREAGEPAMQQKGSTSQTF